ncbi:hypothetical protein Tco_0285287 [Tanacetum coccineum]
MFVFFVNTLLQNTMAEQNVPTQPPILKKMANNREKQPSFQCSKDSKEPHLSDISGHFSNTNFFRAFTASASVPAIYLQQFWNTMKYDEKTGDYRCQINEQWFDLSADLLRKALVITPVIPAQPFELPPSGNTVIYFVNELGYSEPCLTGKTSGSDKPRHLVLQMLWGIVTQTNVDHAELLWEEFTQGIQTFFSHKASHKASLKDPKKKVTPLLSLWTVFTSDNLLLGKQQHQFNDVRFCCSHTGDDFILGNLSLVQKKPLKKVRACNLQQSMLHPKRPQPLLQSNNPSQLLLRQRNLPSISSAESFRKESLHSQLLMKMMKLNKNLFLKKKVMILKLELQKIELKLHQEKGEGEGDDADMERAIKLSLDPAFLPQGLAPVGGVTIRDPVSETTPKLPEVVARKGPLNRRSSSSFPHTENTSEKVIHESSSTSDSERTKSETETAAPKGDKDQGEVDSSTVTSRANIPVSVPEKAHEALARPDPEPMQEDQTDPNTGKYMYERVIEENPESHSGSMSSMKNLDDTYNFGDQFLYDKPTEDDQEKSKVIEESDSTIPDPIPTVVDEYLGTKLDDALLKILERHTADLIEKYSVLPGPESIKNQESEKSPKEIIRIKREQGEEKQDSTYSIRSTDKVALEEFDLKSALFKHMNKNKTANRNPANYHLYHALMEALIADEDAMDKEVAVKVKDHKRKHDSDDDEDDDDDEGPSAGSNQGRSAKRRRPESATSGSAQPPPKDDDQSSKKPRESDASASKQHPALTSTGWQITDTRDDVVNSSMPRSDTESEHSEQSSDDIPMQDETMSSNNLEDKPINAHNSQRCQPTTVRPEGERPATPEPEWTIPPNDFPEPENNWANTYATTYQVPAENKLQRKTYDIGSFIKWFCRRTGKKKLCKADLEGPAFNLVDLGNPEGHQILRNVYEPLPLGGPPGQVTIQPQFFFNKDLDYLLTGDKERKIALSISKLKAARYLDFGLEELVPSLWVESEREYDISAVYGITHWWFRRKEFYINKHSEPSDREAVRSQM